MKRITIFMSFLLTLTIDGMDNKLEQSLKLAIGSTDFHISYYRSIHDIDGTEQAIICGNKKQSVDVKKYEVGEVIRKTDNTLRIGLNVEAILKNSALFCIIEPQTILTEATILKKLYDESGLKNLPRCYENILRTIPAENKTIAIAEFGRCLPDKQRAKIAVTTIINFVKKNQDKYSRIHLLVKDENIFAIYQKMIEEYMEKEVEKVIEASL